MSTGEYDVPSRERGEDYLYRRTPPALTDAVGMTLFQLGKTRSHDVAFFHQTVLSAVQMALWIANKKNEKLVELINQIENSYVVPSYILRGEIAASPNADPVLLRRAESALEALLLREEEQRQPRRKRFKRPRANQETTNAAITAAAHRVAAAAVSAVVEAARKREAAARKMSANVAAAAVATVLKAARQRDSDAVRDQAARMAVVQRANTEAGRKRAIAQKRAVETKLWAKEMKKAAKAEKAAMAEAERRRMQDLERAKAKEARKAEREAKKALLSTKPVNTKTKLVTDSLTSVLPVTKAVTNSKAP
eukprot:1786257-Prymnesium_polylepis.1